MGTTYTDVAIRTISNKHQGFDGNFLADSQAIEGFDDLESAVLKVNTVMQKLDKLEVSLLK